MRGFVLNFTEFRELFGENSFKVFPIHKQGYSSFTQMYCLSFNIL